MSSVIALIYRDEICLASDVKATDHDTGLETETSIKQIVINDKIAVGFAGSGNIAQIMMRAITHPKNQHIISTLTFADIPNVLDDIYASINKESYPDEEMKHVSALIIGCRLNNPEIIVWNSNGSIIPVKQDKPDNFTAFVLPPYDVEQSVCNSILWESACNNLNAVSLYQIATNYFQTISSLSKFVSESATIWTHRISRE